MLTIVPRRMQSAGAAIRGATRPTNVSQQLGDTTSLKLTQKTVKTVFSSHMSKCGPGDVKRGI